ncbi:hypothetical protein [Niallia sp. 03190]|uniref:hypothetical protein n=1 Tax=Niallia sp. 03190 TaxID=3458061 RepID=UPI004044EBDF
MKLLNSNKKLIIASIILVLIFSFIKMGIRREDNYYFFGLPAQWLGYFGGGQFSFEGFGLLFNVLFFYLILRLLNKLIINIKNNNNNKQ